ncbi:MAG TPA: hypothetical protein VIA06_16680 [Candidatus Dormibacteraeota bacterium]|jgi:hypothetical protein|nr:hypothetical protein [Candidatus Dormibacteraeota bacterium]
MGTTSTVIKLVGISAIVPALAPVGMGLVVAGALHRDTRAAIDAGVETGSRYTAAMARTVVRQVGRAYGVATRPQTAALELRTPSDVGIEL